MKRKNPFLCSNPMEELPINEIIRTLPDEEELEDMDETPDDFDEEDLNALIDDFIVRPDEWCRLHPSLSQSLKCGSDKYYANLATSLKLKLMPFSLRTQLPDGTIDECALELTAYLEDLVSAIGVWNAIRELHRSRYGVWLPFYDCEHEDYLLDNVNIEDVQFLIWQSISRCGISERIMYSPFSDVVTLMTDVAYGVLEEEYEKAPEATRVADHIKKIFRSDDFYKVRSLQEWLLFSNPLTRTLEIEEDMLSQAESLSKQLGEKILNQSIYAIMSSMACGHSTGPEGLPAPSYLAFLADAYGFKDIADKLREQKTMSFGMYQVNKVDKDIVVCQDASGSIIDVDKTSFSKYVDFNRAKGLVAAFVKYGELWQQNGMAIEIPVDPFENKSLLKTPVDSVKGIEMANNIAAKHRGRRIFYCNNEEDVSKLIGLPGECSADGDAQLGAILVLLSEIKGVMLLNGYAELIKDKANPFYDKEVAQSDSLELVASGMIPDDIAKILQEKKMLPEATLDCRQGKRFGKRLMQDNLRFFIGFYRS